MAKKTAILITGALFLSMSVLKETWWASFFGLVPLFALLTENSFAETKPFKKNIIFSFVYGIIFYGVCLIWVWSFGWYAYIGLVVLESIFMCIFGGLFHFFIIKKGTEARHQTARFFLMVFGLAFLWTCIDYIRSLGLLGFSWYGIYHFQAYNRLLIQYTSYFGSYCLDFFIVSFDLCIIYLFIKKYPKSFFSVGIFEEFYAFMGIFLFLVLHILALPAIKAPLNAGFAGAVLQGSCNIWTATDFQSLRTYEKLFEEIKEKKDIILMPETAFFRLEQNDYISQVLGDQAKKKGPVIVGANTPAKGRQCYNSAVLIDCDTKWHGKQNKIRLVPFGEYVPKYLPVKVDAMREEDAFKGDEIKILQPENSSVKMACAICYDACFPDFFREASEYANVFGIISNDIWFGKGFAPQNHFMMNVLRAAENRRYILRCGYNGISGLISPYGEVLSATELDENVALMCDFGLNREITMYAKYGFWYPFIAVFIWLFAIPAIIFLRRYR